MQKQHIVLEEAPKRAGPYSHAVIANGFVFVAGQGPVDPTTGEMPVDFGAQVRQALRNMETILKGAGSGLTEVVKVNAYLADLSDFERFNVVYSDFFKEDFPVRTTVGCTLNGILFEVDCVAVLASR
ncbi:2-iminobutanoate/2-iminopropanoate deaminase [Pararhizobium capsulatum DSM 1112]|uniref:2-iminobutanoate/2-iminopropanoate deaminase n=1 Tax=Pararhizobium capsulatum DSM 1112 TaxID=1121113 RepID=A0ABU0C0P5_9HYPH|nr:RidA family protein [Pararhizobium capsulatum]MDQ0324102.1 2-iminobutanoate/2-iminopropanoate deaminase [Pararhizobium capsulatum DSM 1112]